MVFRKKACEASLDAHEDQSPHPARDLLNSSHSHHSTSLWCPVSYLRMLEEEEELDDETIQARLDASLARIYDVTSTWLKPKKTPSAPKKDLEKELEEIMRRPPR